MHDEQHTTLPDNDVEKGNETTNDDENMIQLEGTQELGVCIVRKVDEWQYFLHTKHPESRAKVARDQMNATQHQHTFHGSTKMAQK